MAFKKLIKRFRFTRDQRERLDLSGGLRLNPQTHSIEAPDIGARSGARPSKPVYSTATDLTFRTWLTNPRAIRAFVSMSTDLVAPKLLVQDAPTPLYGIRFRLSNGAQEFYHDGAAWTVATLGGHWNDPGDFAANLPSFPVAQLDPDLGFAIAVNMWTNDARVTPQLKAVKVLYEADIEESDDLLYRSLVPELKALRVRGRWAQELTAPLSELDMSDLDALQFDSSYNVVGVAAAYNATTDPRRLTSIADAYDPNSKVLTLTEQVDAGQVLWVEFEWSPTVSVNTSSEYSEIATVPSIEVDEFDETHHRVDSTYIEDSVLDPVTGAGWKIIGPRVSHVAVRLNLFTDKQVDLRHLKGAFMAWASSNSITMRGLDEDFLMEVTNGPTYSPQGGHADIQTSTLTLMISDVTFYDTPAIEAHAIKRVVFDGGNVQLEIS